MDSRLLRPRATTAVSRATKGMSWACSRRATMRPMRPMPAMTTRGSSSTSGCSRATSAFAGAARNWRDRAIITSGVSAIERVMTSTIMSWTC
ncbi:hypothetical protein D3C78_1399080 [compost metagenome]